MGKFSSFDDIRPYDVSALQLFFDEEDGKK